MKLRCLFGAGSMAGWALLAASALGQASVVLQNDSFTNGSVGVWPLRAGESLGVTLTAGAGGYPYRLDAIQLLAPTGPTKSFAIEIYDDSGAHATANPGALLWTSSNLYSVSSGSGLSEIDLAAESPPVIRSGSIRVALFLAAPFDSVPLNFGTDTSIGLKRNWFRNDLGQWKFLESLPGSSGDLIIRARVTVFAPGDFQEDLDVDGDDLTLWRGGFGASGSATHLQGDADGDHDVDGQDFLIWQRQLGAGPSAAAASAAVPEPTTLVMVFVCALAIYRRPRMTAWRVRRRLAPGH